jgi:hypothetical protein
MHEAGGGSRYRGEGTAVWPNPGKKEKWARPKINNVISKLFDFFKKALIDSMKRGPSQIQKNSNKIWS